MKAPRGIATDEDLLAAGVPRAHRDAVVQGVVDRELAVGEPRRSKAVVRGAARSEQSFFELLEADLVQAAIALSGSDPLALAPPARRRLRWRD